jgi:hypothetical protein
MQAGLAVRRTCHRQPCRTREGDDRVINGLSMRSCLVASRACSDLTRCPSQRQCAVLRKSRVQEAVSVQPDAGVRCSLARLRTTELGERLARMR